MSAAHGVSVCVSGRGGTVGKTGKGRWTDQGEGGCRRCKGWLAPLLAFANIQHTAAAPHTTPPPPAQPHQLVPQAHAVWRVYVQVVALYGQLVGKEAGACIVDEQALAGIQACGTAGQGGGGGGLVTGSMRGLPKGSSILRSLEQAALRGSPASLAGKQCR